MVLDSTCADSRLAANQQHPCIQRNYRCSMAISAWLYSSCKKDSYFCWTNICFFFCTVVFIQQIKLLEVAAELSKLGPFCQSLVCNAGSFYQPERSLLSCYYSLQEYMIMLFLKYLYHFKYLYQKIPFLLFLSFFGRTSSQG